MKELELDQVVGFRLEIAGATLTISCSCGERFDSPQGSLGGLPLAIHVCPRCTESRVSPPRTSLAIIARFIPDHGHDELLAINRGLTELAESWHRRGPWPAALDADGVELGPPMERELQAHLLDPLLVERGEPT